MLSDPFSVTKSPTTEPESLLIGSFTQWRRLLDYSDATYALSYRLIPSDRSANRTIAGAYDSDNQWWTFSVGSSDTTSWVSGRYRWDLILTRTSDGEEAVISTGSIIIHATRSERRTHAEVMLAKIESLLEGRADSDIESYSIKSRNLTKMSVKELREWREYYAAEIERTGGSATSGKRPYQNTIRVGFR